MKTLTIVSHNKFDSQLKKWDVIENILLDYRDGFYPEANYKNYIINRIKSDYVLWINEDVTADEVDNILVRGRSWGLIDLIERQPYTSRALLVPTNVQKETPWRNIPALDYDMRLRLTVAGCSFKTLEGIYDNKDWLTNAVNIQEAYRHRRTLDGLRYLNNE